MTNKTDSSEDCVCKKNCFYYKPDRKEKDRCLGYTLARILIKTRPQLILESDSEAFNPTFKKNCCSIMSADPAHFILTIVISLPPTHRRTVFRAVALFFCQKAWQKA
jgi:hypothetical protein